MNKIIVYKNTEQLVNYTKNSRKHSTDQIKRIENSIKEFGFTNPILIDKNSVIVAGHARVEAAKNLGIDSVPTIELSELTETQIRAYVIADNKLAELSFFDDAILKEELESLSALDFDLSLIGFDDFNIDILEAKEDDYQIPDEVKTDIVLGDLFEIGEHRLLCGDSTSADDVVKLLNNKEPYLMITDPPYGIEYKPEWRNESTLNKNEIHHGRSVGKVLNDDKSDWTEAWALSPAKVAYIYHADKFSGTVQKSLEDCDFEIRCQIIWVKNHFAIGRGDYHYKHEPCWYAVKKGNKGNWASDRKQTTVWEIKKSTLNETGHSTQKPVECMSKPISNHDGDVYDPFLGSGTTMVAAHQLNRKCYGMELEPKYCQIIIDRIRKLDPKIIIKRNGEIYESA